MTTYCASLFNAPDSNFWALLIRCSIIFLIGVPIFLVISSLVSRSLGQHLSAQGTMLVRKGIRYLGFLLVIITIVSQLDIDLAPVLGAAGVAGVAIGFAAQTSLSNMISGFFLIAERPFKVGDIIRVGQSLGTVESIDLLSSTIRTFENQGIRIPNETIVKSEVTNLTKYPLRRFDLVVGISYSDDPDTAREILRAACLSVPDVLRQPEPLVVFTGFGDSSQNFKIGAWCTREDFGSVMDKVPAAIRKYFDQAGIEIPYPHLTIAQGKANTIAPPNSPPTE